MHRSLWGRLRPAAIATVAGQVEVLAPGNWHARDQSAVCLIQVSSPGIHQNRAVGFTRRDVTLVMSRGH